MAVEKFWSSRKPTAEFSTFVGEKGEIFYYPVTGNMRLSDGVTPGGLPLAVGDVVGITHVEFDTSHIPTGDEPTGTLAWSNADETLNIYHPDGVVQQVGQELYAFVRNNTGSLIPNGTVCRFDGADINGESRLEVTPFLADGTYPSLYTIGIATQDIEDGGAGRITVWGKVRDIDTTGASASETWTLGDILYCSPTVAGNFTNVKPRAPNNVVPIAAVINVNGTGGELFVRPTIEQKRSYGVFARTTNLTVAVIDTAYTVEWDSTEISNGVTVGTPTSRLVVDQSGMYTITVNAQVTANTGGGFTGGTMYMWLRVNGVDIDDSMRRQAALGNEPANTFSLIRDLLLDENDYVEIVYAGDDVDLIYEASAATSFGPSTAAATVNITHTVL